jgi:MFS family permease
LPLRLYFYLRPSISALFCLRARYPTPQHMEVSPAGRADSRLPLVFCVYLSGAALVAAGFADYPLIAYHFSRSGAVTGEAVAVFYSVAMAVSGTGSLVLGRLFDRFGFVVLVTLTLTSALFAPLVFLGGFWVALIGAALWGLGMGVHESIIPAVVAPMVSPHRRASALGQFTAGYGVFWFVGSAVIGILYDLSLPAVIAFCMLMQLGAVPIFIWVGRHMRKPIAIRSHAE